jgi:hypothetical protein
MSVEDDSQAPLGFLVKTVVLDNVLQDVPRIDVIKMDIEGAEPRAFQGMRQIIQKHRPIIFTEFCPVLIRSVSGIDPQLYLNELLSCEYDLFILECDEKSAEPRSSQQIMDYFSQLSGTDHIDLVAYPR